MKPGRLKANIDEIERVATDVLPAHKALAEAGYTLGGKSGLWLNKRGEVTARFVYRRPNISVVFSIRGLRVVWAD